LMARVLFEASAIFCSSPRYPKISSMLIDIASVELTDGRVVVIVVAVVVVVVGSDVDGGGEGDGDDKDNLPSTISNRLISVPRVAAASANVIIPNRPMIPNTAYKRLSADPAIFINNLFYEKILLF